MAGSNPCLNHDCHACCVGTMMTLTNEDVARLEALGRTGFCRVTASGGLQLVNRGGRCVFLLDGVCSVYPDRPEGCQLYPLILDTDADQAVLDDFCPYASEFTFDHADERRLRFSVATEHREATARWTG
jgi:Fe-S-cluster containining protein